MDDGYFEALKRIREAKKSKAKELDLSGLKLTQLPDDIGQLIDLRKLYLYNNRLGKLPSSIGELVNLEVLNLTNNRLIELPLSIDGLINLQELYLSDNPKLSLSQSVVTNNLQKLYINNTALVIPDEIRGLEMHVYIRFVAATLKSSRRLWRSKLLVVGEGGSGKTSLLLSLKGEQFDPLEVTTRGFEIRSLDLPHPQKKGVNMNLSAWDFGGQEIYHATHQFFLSDRSLFILVWNARLGWEQGKLYYWLDQINARAPKSPVLIVATHIEKHPPDLPIVDLCTRHENIIGTYAVSNEKGDGIDTLRQAIINTASKLPLMGQEWPTTWLLAVESVNQRQEQFLSQRAFYELLKTRGVAREDTVILSRVLHDLGDILFFMDDEELRNRVILKPQWLTGYIYRIIDDKEVQVRGGILSTKRMKQLWHDLNTDLRQHFLHLMERFDLSYRIPEDKRDRSLVVELLSLNPPSELSEKWSKIQLECPMKVEMHFRLSTMPAGVPTWFIARSHRFTTNIHWRSGALFVENSEERHHHALVRAYAGKQEIRLIVHGPQPHNFFTLLRDGLELTLGRFPGLEIEYLVPCPGLEGEVCSHRFKFEHLTKFFDKGIPTILCPECLEDIPVTELIFGMDLRTTDQVMQKLEDISSQLADHQQAQQDQFEAINNLTALVQRQHLAATPLSLEAGEHVCPRVFILSTPKDKIWTEKMTLELCCEAPGKWHPMGKEGRYIIEQPAQWIKPMVLYVEKLNKILKFAVPFLTSGLATMEELQGFKDEFQTVDKSAGTLASSQEILSDISVALYKELGESSHHKSEGAQLRILCAWLSKMDPEKKYGGLIRTKTPEGHLFWLCEEHLQEYR